VFVSEQAHNADLTSQPQLSQQRVEAARAHPHLSRFRQYVERLAEFHGMSGDETDHRTAQNAGNRQYAIVAPYWRAPDLSKWLYVYDKVYLSTRFHGNGRARPGNWSRIRHTSGRVDRDSLPISGLPRNFYSMQFLAGLDAIQLAELDVKPPINLGFSDHINAYVLFHLSGLSPADSKRL
jgi:hypothetical protein